MTAIAEIKREVYLPFSEERGAPVVSCRYLGAGVRREERRMQETASDWCEGDRVRASEDNGRTWSDWRSVQATWPLRDGFSREERPVAWVYDPVSGQTVRFVFQRFLMGEGPEAIQQLWRTGRQTYFDHGYWQTSDDEGRTWSEMRQLRYEGGVSPESGGTPTEDYLMRNAMYACYSAIVTQTGTVAYPVAAVMTDVEGPDGMERVEGVVCFIGVWNAEAGAYEWEVSEPLGVPHCVSGRGLMEPTIAELADGRLMLSMRGSTNAVEAVWKDKKATNPGHCWKSLSSDGGRTWSPVEPMRFDTGESFYCPSAYSLLMRHSGTGRLCWFGNITPEPPDGNLPRYPLYIAEVEETTVTLKKDTLTVIDDYDPERDSEKLQLSNFCVLEDRETGAIELYLTRYGEYADHWLHANAYKYTLTML